MSSEVPRVADGQLYVNAKREAVILLLAFVVFLVWSITTSFCMGYNVAPEDLKQTVWGMPRWVFWGIAVPWMTANVFTLFFCMFYMADDALGDVVDEDDA